MRSNKMATFGPLQRLATYGLILGLTAATFFSAGVQGTQAADADSQQVRISAQDSSSKYLRLGLNKSMIVDLPRDAVDVLVSNPKIADAAGDVSLELQIAGVAILPSVINQTVINPNPNSIIRAQAEQVVAAFKTLAAGPTRREIVGRYGRPRRAIPPIVVDTRLIAHQYGRTGQIDVIKIFGFPVRESINAFPAQDGQRPARGIEIFHLDAVRAAGQIDIGAVGGGRGFAPLIDQQVAIHPQPNAVIGSGVEAIGPGGKIEGARPAGRKVVCR